MMIAWLTACASSGGDHAANRKFAALVVGMSYETSGDAGYYLENTVNDARLIASKLGQLTETFSSVTMVLNADKEKFQSGLEQFARPVDKNTVVLFYYSGHGIQVESRNYLVPDDLDGYIPVREVIRYLRARAKGVIIVIDACRTNPLAGREWNVGRPLKFIEVGVPGMASRGIVVTPGDYELDGLAKPEIAGSRVMVVFATDPGDVALDALPGSVNSPFSTAFANNILEIKSFEEVMADVSMDLEAYSIAQPNIKKQTPWRESSWTEPLYLAGKPDPFSSGVYNLVPPP